MKDPIAQGTQRENNEEKKKGVDYISRLFRWIEEARHSENISDENCYGGASIVGCVFFFKSYLSRKKQTAVQLVLHGPYY